MTDTASMPMEKHNRIESVDLVRGLIIIVMALDHHAISSATLAARSDRDGHNHTSALLHPLDHAFLRPGFFSSHRNRRLSIAGADVEAGIVALSGQPRHLADLPGNRGDAVRAAVQSRLSRDVPHRAVGARLGDDRAGSADLAAGPDRSPRSASQWSPVTIYWTASLPMRPSAPGAPLWSILRAPGIVLNNGHMLVVSLVCPDPLEWA